MSEDVELSPDEEVLAGVERYTVPCDEFVDSCREETVDTLLKSSLDSVLDEDEIEEFKKEAVVVLVAFTFGRAFVEYSAVVLVSLALDKVLVAYKSRIEEFVTNVSPISSCLLVVVSLKAVLEEVFGGLLVTESFVEIADSDSPLGLFVVSKVVKVEVFKTSAEVVVDWFVGGAEVEVEADIEVDNTSKITTTLWTNIKHTEKNPT